MLTLPSFASDKIMTGTWSWTTAACTAVACYLVIELAFYIYFHTVLVPRANQRIPANPYLDYPRVTDRHLLLQRVLERLQHKAVVEGVPLSTVLTKFFVQWFGKVQDSSSQKSSTITTRLKSAMPALMRTQSSSWTTQTTTSSSSTNSSSNSSTASALDDTDSITSTEEEAPLPSAPLSSASASEPPPAFWSIPGIGNDEITEFLAWALFAKDNAELTACERQELAKCLDVLRVHSGLVFPPLTQSPYRPRRLCLEDVSPLHRPLLVYVWVEVLRAAAGVVLRLAGFRPTRNSALPGWYRPGPQNRQKQQASSSDSSNKNNQEATSSLPLIFFHGIAPAGLTFYLPMILSIVSDKRPTLLVEQPSISGRLLTFGALDETEMMQAVEEMVAETIDVDPTTRQLPLLWAGHSFGSCPLTWMWRRSTLKSRTAGLLLLDPVTILLSEPAVMLNFLYTREISKIRMVAASELFTEYYLRRHFAWYNAEAWVADIASETQVTVALSECDEIVDAPAVAAHLKTQPSVRTIYWPTARHAHCVTSPTKWRQLQQALWEQESLYWRQQSSS